MKNLIVKADAKNRNVIFFAETAANGQIDCFVDGSVKRVGIDWYNLAKPLDNKEVVKTVEAFRVVTNTPEEEINIRSRLPKGYALNSAPEATPRRRLNDTKPEQIVHAAHVEQPHRRASDGVIKVSLEKTPKKDAVVSVIEAIHANESSTEISNKMKAALFSEARNARKQKRVEAAKRRYEAEVEATNRASSAGNFQGAVVQSEQKAAPAQEAVATPEATVTLSPAQLSEIVAKAVASAIAAVVPVAA